MADLALSEEDLAYVREQYGHKYNDSTVQALLATLDFRDQRIKELEEELLMVQLERDLETSKALRRRDG